LTTFRVIKTNHCDKWFRQLKDIRAAARIQIDRLASGNPGDVRPVGAGISGCGSATARATGSTTSRRAMW
jgi:putative component of toxin-antitoxin plasmid stabilization module